MGRKPGHGRGLLHTKACRLNRRGQQSVKERAMSLPVRSSRKRDQTSQQIDAGRQRRAPGAASRSPAPSGVRRHRGIDRARNPAARPAPRRERACGVPRRQPAAGARSLAALANRRLDRAQARAGRFRAHPLRGGGGPSPRGPNGPGNVLGPARRRTRHSPRTSTGCGSYSRTGSMRWRPTTRRAAWRPTRPCTR